MMKIKKNVSFILLLTCMVSLGLSFGVKNAQTAKAQDPTVALSSVDIEYNNSVWDGNTMAVGLMFDKNFTAKAYDGNEGGFDSPVVAEVKNYTKINGQSGVIQLSFLVEENANRIVFLYDNSLLTVPEGQEYTTFTIDAGAPFGGEYLPEINLQLKDGKWTIPPKSATVNLSSVDIEYNNSVWGGNTMAVGLIFDKNFTAKAYDTNPGSWNDPLISAVRAYTKINGQSGVIENSFLVEENANRIVFLYDNSLLTVPEGQEYTTFTIDAGAPFGGEILPEITLQLKDGKWTVPAKSATVNLSSVDTEYNNFVWGGTTMALGLIFDKNFTAKAYDANPGKWDDPLISAVRAYTKINGQLGVIENSFLVTDNTNRIVFLYDNSLLTVPEGQEYATFTIDAGAPFGGEYLPAITLYLVDGKWQATEPVPDPDPVTENVTVTKIHNREGSGQKLLLFISKNDYTAGNFDITAKIANVNVLDFVNVYTSETEFVSLREIYGDKATSFIWGEANSIAFAIDANYHGTAVYAVEIKEGAQFPASTNNYVTYVTTEDIIYYNVNYKGDASINGLSTTWTTEKPATPEVPDEPEVPTLGTPDVEFVEIHADNNISWFGSATTYALRLVFSENFEALAYDSNPGGYYDALIADIRSFTTINGNLIDDITFLQDVNGNSITFLYSVGLLNVPSGENQTVFHIEAGAPFGGRYLPAVTLYFNGENWQTEETTVEEMFTGIRATQNNSAWGETQKAVRIEFNYNFNNTESYNINDADGLNLISKLTFNGAPVTESDILVFTEDIGGNTITILYNNVMLDWDLAEGLRYHVLSLTESVNYLGVDIPAFTLYLRKDTWTAQYPELVEIEDVETAVGYNTSSLIHIRDWNLDGDETTAVNNMILFFLPSGGFPEGHNHFLNLDKVAEYNVFDKIKLHMITPNEVADEDGFVTLGQVFNAGGWYASDLSGGKDKIVVVNMWETENCIAFSMGAEYTAESFDYIVIEEGCEFPNYYYTNGNGAIDYVQNGEYVDYENVDKVSFIQTCDVKIYTNPDDFQGPSLNTNWAIDANMGDITVSGVDYKDGYVIIELEGSNYPTEANGENLNQNISAGNAPMSLNMLADIYVNGISLYDRVVAFGANGITSYYNYNGYANFAISVVLVNENEVVNEIIVAKDLKVPLYGLSEMAFAAYGVMYTETKETVSYTKGEQGFTKDETIYWTLTFNDGENVTMVRVADGETLSSSDIPATPTKEGFEFVAWVYGIDGIYTFEATSAIKSSYYLTASWTEKVETSEPTKDSESQSSSNGGCFGSLGSIDMIVGLLAVAGGMLFVKKRKA